MSGIERFEALKQHHEWLKRSRKQDFAEIRSIENKIYRRRNSRKVLLLDRIHSRMKNIEMALNVIEYMFKEFDNLTDNTNIKKKTFRGNKK